MPKRYLRMPDGSLKPYGNGSGGGADAPVTSVNGQTGDVQLSAEDVGALPAGTAIPSKTSDLQNDSGFITKAVQDLTNYYTKSQTYTQAEVNSLVSAIPKFSISVVSALPVSGISTTTVYLLGGGAGSDLYTEYIYVNGAWEILGSQRVDLTGYATETWVNTKLADYLKSTELESAINTALAQAKASGEFDGESYVLTEADKNAIAQVAAGMVNVPVQSVNGKTGDVELTASDVGAATKEEVADKANITDVFESSLQPTFTNVFDTIGIEYGKMLESDGSVSDTTAPLCITDFIPVKAGDVIRVNEDFQLYNASGSNTPKIVTYDSAFAKLNHVNNTSLVEGGYFVERLEINADGNITAFRINRPTGVAYVRICNNTGIVGKNPVLTINEEITYDEQYGHKLNPRIRVDQSQITNSPQKNGWNILPNENIASAYSSIGRKPINTIEHFTDAATNYSYNALKCDVRPTSDGELVCCHDAGFTFDGNGYITTYDSSNQTLIHNVTASTCLGYSFKTGEHPCLVGDYLKVCRTYGKVAFITIRNEYMDVVIPKLIAELKAHNMMYSTIINCMTYDSLVTWRTLDSSVMINYTLSYGAAIDKVAIDKAVALGYCSLCGFSLNSSQIEPTATCDFEYARECGIRVGQAIAYKEGSPEKCFEMGYDLCQIGIPWHPASDNGYTKAEIDAMFGSYIDDIAALVGGDA